MNLEYTKIYWTECLKHKPFKLVINRSYEHTVVYSYHGLLLVNKRESVMKYMTVWMNLTDIMLNERIWTQAHIVEINLYKVKEQTNESLIIEISSGCLCTWRAGGGGVD